MPTILSYGKNSSLTLDIAPESLVAVCGAPVGAIADPAGAMAAALAEPVGYPALAQAVVPGDRLAIVLDDELPRAAELVAGTVRTLLASGIEPENISVLQTRLAAERRATAELQARLAANVASEIEWVEHDPASTRDLCYLGVAENNEGIYLNRAIYDADLVIPITCLRMRSATDSRGVFADLYPAFSGEGALERFRQPLSRKHPEVRADRRRETEQAGWMLGVRLVIDVVPAAGGEVLHVLAGDIDAISERGKQLSIEAWGDVVPRPARLVIAAITGDVYEQSWDNVARALSAARRVATDDGIVALCTELSADPGPALGHLATAQDLHTARLEIRHERSADATAAAQVARALERGTVYLLSNLDAERVEQLGFAPVGDPSDIARLARRFDSCIVLANAQYAVPSLAGD